MTTITPSSLPREATPAPGPQGSPRGPLAQAGLLASVLLVAVAIMLGFVPSASASTTLSAPAAAAAPALRSAAAGSNGVVAVHTGSWGYKEIVYGKVATKQIANSSVWDISTLLLSMAGGYGLAGALDVQLVKFRAQDAVNTGQCFPSSAVDGHMRGC